MERLKHLLEQHKEKYQLIMFFTFFPDRDKDCWEIGIMRRKDDRESDYVSGCSGDNIDKLIEITCKNIEEYIKRNRL